jgi:8-oxo-dGTP pyrophosphatase MutT (NUDIX family)
MSGTGRSYTKDELLRVLRARLSPVSDAPPFLGPDHAAVVMLITLRGGSVEALFAKRAEDPGDAWSGQIAFPGGRSKAIDATLAQTACREFFEETFVDICKRAEMLGFLETVNPRNRPSTSVTPFVAYSDRKFVFTPSPELIEVFWAPLETLERKAVDVNVGGALLRGVPAFVYGTHIIWGLTAHMVEAFRFVLATG